MQSLIRAILAFLASLARPRAPRAPAPVPAPRLPSELYPVPRPNPAPILVPPVPPPPVPPPPPPPAPPVPPPVVVRKAPLVVRPDYETYGMDAKGDLPQVLNLGAFAAAMFRGYLAPLSQEARTAFCLRNGVQPAALTAVIKVETIGRGMDPKTCLPIVLYEGHKFGEYSNYRFNGSHPHLSWTKWGERPYKRTQAERWAQFAEAYALDPRAAICALSWGLFQIMGFNWEECGCKSIEEFIDRVLRGEDSQILLFEAYLKRRRLMNPLQECDWYGVAIYNGTGQRDKYAAWLADEYKAAVAAEQRAARATHPPRKTPDPWS